MGAAHFINEGLKSERLCVYASVHAFDGESKLNVTRLSSRIIDYDLNVKNGNIQFIDFEPFYEAALDSNISPFVHLKTNWNRHYKIAWQMVRKIKLLFLRMLHVV